MDPKKYQKLKLSLLLLTLTTGVFAHETKEDLSRQVANPLAGGRIITRIIFPIIMFAGL